MKKKYPLKPTKKQIKIFKEGWKQLMVEYDKFWERGAAITKWMSDESGIRDVEFINVDGEWAGIGNTSRTMKLIQRESLE